MSIIYTINDWLWGYLLIGAALWFTVRSRGVQFRMAGEMLRLLAGSGKKAGDGKQYSASRASARSWFP